MDIKCNYNCWELTAGSTVIDVSLTEHVVSRPAQLGDQKQYGSLIVIKGSFHEYATELKVHDPEYPNVEPSLEQVLNTHIRQLKLGTFGEVTSPAHVLNDRDLLEYFYRQNKQPAADVDREYHRIPINLDGKQCWAVGALAGYNYRAYRKYNDTYYVTKVVREMNSYVHPLNDAAPELNIIKRTATVEVASVTAKPFDFKEIEKLFA